MQVFRDPRNPEDFTITGELPALSDASGQNGTVSDARLSATKGKSIFGRRRYREAGVTNYFQLGLFELGEALVAPGVIELVVLFFAAASTLLALQFGKLAWIALLPGVGIFALANAVVLGRTRFGIEREFGRLQGHFAANLDDVLVSCYADARREISEEAARRLVTGMLHRIKLQAMFWLQSPDDLIFRATLAVPVDIHSGSPQALRVWCYDQPYSDRRWTKFPIKAPGAPTAFVNRRPETIKDVHALDHPTAKDRDFRSVLCIPVQAGGLGGQPLAVVSLDVRERDYFDDWRVTRLLPLVAPTITAIAFTLCAKREDSPYVFGPETISV